MFTLIILLIANIVVGNENKQEDYVLRADSRIMCVESIYGIPLTPELMPYLRINNKDVAYAMRLDPLVKSRLAEFVAEYWSPKSEIISARKIGDFILVFYDEIPEEEGLFIADGGFELVYSIKEQKVLGLFMGDYRG